jgi:multiple sugar transport system permease protein
MAASIGSASSTSTGGGRIGRLRREGRRTSGWGGLLYLVPALVLLLVFEVWPIFFSIYVSLWRWDVKPLDFIGLENYRTLFADGFVTRDYKGDLVPGEVANSMLVTIYYVVGTVPIVIGLSFIFAFLLFRGVKGQGIFRTIYFLPYITASVAVAMVFTLIFNPKFGVANAAMEQVGLPAQKWLQDPTPALKAWTGWTGIGFFQTIPDWLAGPSIALVVVCIYSIWASLGYAIVIYLAGLTSIPRDLADAARLDGASEWTVMRTVIWPLLRPTTAFLTITSTIGSFQAFNPIFTLTRGSGLGRSEAGAPLDTTLTITVYIFRNFYERSNAVGYASAVAIFLSIMLLGLTLLQFRWYGRDAHLA